MRTEIAMALAGNETMAEMNAMKRIWTAVMATLMLASVVPAQASLVRGFSLQQLRSEAHRVVVGKVTAARSFWNEGKDKIYTEYTVEVQRVVKGEKVSKLTVRLMGGRVGERELTVSGNPSIDVGERVLLFLRDYDSFHAVVGMSQGKWSVRTLDGQDHVYRGPAQTSKDRQAGEIALEKLLEQTRTHTDDAK